MITRLVHRLNGLKQLLAAPLAIPIPDKQLPDLLPGITQHVRKLLIGFKHPSLRIQHHDTVPGMLNQHPPSGGFLGERLLYPLVLGDIRVRAEDPQRLAVRRAGHHLALVQHPLEAAVLAADPVFAGVLWSFAVQVALDFHQHRREIVRMNPRFPFGQRAADLIRRKAQHGFPACAEKHLVGQRIPIPDSLPTAFQREFPALFARLKLPGRLPEPQEIAVQRDSKQTGGDENKKPPLGLFHQRLKFVILHDMVNRPPGTGDPQSTNEQVGEGDIPSHGRRGPNRCRRRF